MQTYQQLTTEIIKEIPNIEKFSDIQYYFYLLKEKEPDRFDRLNYDENGHIPYSNTLESIIDDLILAGFI